MRVLSSATARVYQCVKCGALVEDASAKPVAEAAGEVTTSQRPPELTDPFAMLLRDAGLAGFIRNEVVSWADATNEFRGFEVVR